MKKSKRSIAIVLMVLCVLSFIGVNKANAVYVNYVNKAEIQINNLPKNEKVEVEVIVVKEALDFDNLDVKYSESFKQEYFEIIKNADGVFDGEKTVFVGHDSQNKPINKQEQTKYYYKTLDKKTVNNGDNIKFDIYVPYSIFEEFGSSIAVRINDKYSSLLRLDTLEGGTLPHITKYYCSVDYETMKFIFTGWDESGVGWVSESFMFVLAIILFIIIIALFQVMIELLISKIFKIGNTKIILEVNIISQILLNIIILGISVLLSFTNGEMICLAIATELVIVFFEFLLYKKKIKDVYLKKLATFTIVANVCSLIISYVLLDIFLW